MTPMKNGPWTRQIAWAASLWVGLPLAAQEPMPPDPAPAVKPITPPLPGSGDLSRNESPTVVPAPIAPPPPAASATVPTFPDSGVEPIAPGPVPPPLSPDFSPQLVPDFASQRGGLGDWLNPDVGHLLLRANYGIAWLPNESVQGQGTDLGFVRNDFTFSFPVWQDTRNEWSASTRLSVETFHTGAVLPDTRQPFPHELWNIGFGTSYRHLFDNAWIGGATLQFGSASDKPFHSIEEMFVGVSAFLRLPQGEHNAWLFSLHYSPLSELPFPVPGVAYIYQPSEYFRANIGLPLQLMYRPIDELTFDFSYMLLTNIHARATYRLAPRIRIYAGYDWNNESYFLADRTNDNDRLFYFDQRLTAGVLFPIAPYASIDLSGGFSFDRFYFEGQHFSDRNHNRIDVGDAPFLALRFQARW
jgi:hypothetical protein